MPKVHNYGEAERMSKRAPAIQETIEESISVGDLLAAIGLMKGENERLRQQVADLDEMPRKPKAGTASDLKGIEDINTCVTKRVRSMPGGDDKLYLDLYLMQKERERLRKETTWVKKRRVRVGKRYEDNTGETARKERLALEEMSILQEEADKLTAETAEASGGFDKTGTRAKYAYSDKKAPRMKTQPADY